MTALVTGISPANAPGFTFDGQHSSAYGIYLLRSSISGMPQTADQYKEIPGRHGVFDFGFRFEGRKIELECFVLAQNEADLRKKVREIAAWLDPNKGERPLVLDTEPDKFYNVRVSGSLDVEIVAGQGRMTIPFLASEPFAYSTAERRRPIAGISAAFTRSSVAYKQDGSQVAANEPRFEAVGGRVGVLVEEETTNLLTLNQSDVESSLAGLQGLSSFSQHTFYMDVEEKVFGSASAKITSNYSGTQSISITTQPERTPVTGGQVYTFSVYAKASTSARNWQVTVFWFASNGSQIGSIASTPVPASTTWTRLTFTVTAPSNAATAYCELKLINAANGDALWWDGAQFEQKPFATAWVPGGTTRAAETLTVPTFGVLSAEEGSVELLAYVGPSALSTNTNATQYLFSVSENPDWPYPNTLALRRTSANGSWQAWSLDENGNATTATAPQKIGDMAPGVHYFALGWSKAEKKLVLAVDGVEVAVASNPYLPSRLPEQAYLGLWAAGILHGNAHIVQVRFSNRLRTPEEWAAAFAAGELTADDATTAIYTFADTLEPDVSPVSNDGTVPAYPVIRAYVHKPITYLAVVTEDRQVILGKPDTVEDTPTEKETQILYDQLRSLDGWGPGVTVDGGVITGAFQSDGEDLRVQSYGTGSQWHGPAVKKTLPEQLQDFRVIVWVSLYNVPKKLGRLECYLLDQNDAVIGKVALLDKYPTTDDVWAEARAGAWGPGYYFVNTHGLQAGVWNQYHGVMQIERQGNVWKAFFGKYSYSQKQFHTRWSAQYIDTQNKYSTPKLAAIQLHAGAYGTHTVADMWFNAVIVYRLNTVQPTQIPYIATAGDELVIDCARAAVYRNGYPAMDLLDVASEFLYLPAKRSALIEVTPADAAVVEASWRERWL